MTSAPQFSLAFTFFNEEGNVLQVIPPLVEALDHAHVSFQLVLVDNGSKDRTGELLESLALNDARLSVVRVAVNEGYGGGILAGLAGAAGRYVGYLSGDGQVAPTDVLSALTAMGEGTSDLVKVRRIVRKDGAARAVVSKAYNLFMQCLFGCPSHDLNGTPKIFRRELLSVFDLQSKDWFIDPEIMIKAARMGLSVRELPIVFNPRKEGKSAVRVGTIFEFLKNAICFAGRKEYRVWKRQKLSSWRAA